MSILMITLDDRPGGSGPVFGVAGWVRSRFGVGILVDSEIVLSTSYGKTMVFINKNLINRDRLSTRPYQQRPLINKVDSW